MEKHDTIREHSTRIAYSCCLAVLLAACATVKSGSHHDESASFEHYRTFSWIAEQPLIIGRGENQPVWHGWASKTISTSDRRDPSPSIAVAVTALFAEFPPIDAKD